ncbi:MAG TPA: Na+/H+ antiporter [Chitinophagaceae bacterium]|jgi:CPA1 family monovalent cation:H+ antiporter|nr:Na+/H+ antiporter [Chitinophagaceae bacterium]
MANIEVIVLLLLCITFLALFSNKYNFPFPIVLVLSGLAISLFPGITPLTLAPDVIFLIFLPPLLYSAAWNTNWHQFKANLRHITLASIGLVFFTTLCIGILVHEMIPGFTYAQAFLLGAIISPPDAVSATSITKGLGLEPRVVTILEGESLINDASALIAFKYALGAATIGSFSLSAASVDFLKVFGGGIGIGLIIGYLMFLLHKHFIKESNIDATLTFLTPFACYLLAEQFHFSGVLAVVTCGLYLAYRSTEIFSHQSRIQVFAVWDVISFILNGFVFVLMGLQLKIIIQDFSKSTIINLSLYGLVISIVAFLVRLFYTVPAVVLPRKLSKRISQEPFDIRNILVFTWAGMRGIVSMAAALSIPAMIGQEKFPNRSEIIFLSFSVILFTLLVQGLSLPYLIKRLRLKKHSILAEEYEIRSKIIDHSKNYIDETFGYANDKLRSLLHDKYDIRNSLLQQTTLPIARKGKVSSSTAIFNEYAEWELQVLKIERKKANELHKEGKVSEEVFRKIEREIDLEEARLRLELFRE